MFPGYQICMHAYVIWQVPGVEQSLTAAVVLRYVHVHTCGSLDQASRLPTISGLQLEKLLHQQTPLASLAIMDVSLLIIDTAELEAYLLCVLSHASLRTSASHTFKMQTHASSKWTCSSVQIDRLCTCHAWSNDVGCFTDIGSISWQLKFHASSYNCTVHIHAATSSN